MAFSGALDTKQFWKLIEEARSQVPAPDNGDAVAERAANCSLFARPRRSSPPSRPSGA
ncbi:hypothetical protein [Streptomyces sp. NPDC059171]|uniref:hypothetical protein n=1 Tax=Streptomyces sp. NPDC059171 TaxID=3346755 RepID=UPI00368D137D